VKAGEIRIMTLLPAIFLAASLTAAPVPLRTAGGPAARSGEAESAGACFAVVCLDADLLACSPCGASLLEFNRTVPPDILEERVVGVLSFREDAAVPDPRKARLARTRWTGYCRANGIRFRAAVDETHALDRLSERGMTILLFDAGAGILRRWTAPFEPGVLEDIIRFLTDEKQL